MPKAVDYFGLIAYMFVMYGGLPGSDSLWSDVRTTGQNEGPRSKLKLVASDGKLPRRKRRPAAPASAQEFAA